MVGIRAIMPLNAVKGDTVMRKLLGLLLGVSLGAGAGITLVKLSSSNVRKQVVSRLKQGWQESMEEARQAAQQHRHDMEAELAASRLKAQD